MMDKSFMFWGTGANGAYKDDGIPVPRATYRCKTTTRATKQSPHAVKQAVTHNCKKVTDHPGGCLCICGVEFGAKEESNV